MCVSSLISFCLSSVPVSPSVLSEVQTPGLCLSVLLFSLFQVFSLEEKGNHGADYSRLDHSELDSAPPLLQWKPISASLMTDNEMKTMLDKGNVPK